MFLGSAEHVGVVEPSLNRDRWLGPSWTPGSSGKFPLLLRMCQTFTSTSDRRLRQSTESASADGGFIDQHSNALSQSSNQVSDWEPNICMLQFQEPMQMRPAGGLDSNQ